MIPKCWECENCVRFEALICMLNAVIVHVQIDTEKKYEVSRISEERKKYNELRSNSRINDIIGLC